MQPHPFDTPQAHFVSFYCRLDIVEPLYFTLASKDPTKYHILSLLSFSLQSLWLTLAFDLFLHPSVSDNVLLTGKNNEQLTLTEYCVFAGKLSNIFLVDRCLKCVKTEIKWIIQYCMPTISSCEPLYTIYLWSLKKNVKPIYNMLENKLPLLFN